MATQCAIFRNRHSSRVEKVSFQLTNKSNPLFISLLIPLIMSAQLPVFAQHDRGVSNSITVNAKPQCVYHAIQKARTTTGSRRLVSYKNNQAIIEEFFDGLPLIGSAKCLYQENETSPTRIDYTMIESDKLSRFEGAWILTPQADGKTAVTLTSNTACAIKLPFVDKLATQSAIRRVERRLHEIATAAEAEQRTAYIDEQRLVAHR